jgi:hypothetical protein
VSWIVIGIVTVVERDTNPKISNRSGSVPKVIVTSSVMHPSKRYMTWIAAYSCAGIEYGTVWVGISVPDAVPRRT